MFDPILTLFTMIDRFTILNVFQVLEAQNSVGIDVWVTYETSSRPGSRLLTPVTSVGDMPDTEAAALLTQHLETNRPNLARLNQSELLTILLQKRP